MFWECQCAGPNAPAAGREASRHRSERSSIRRTRPTPSDRWRTRRRRRSTRPSPRRFRHRLLGPSGRSLTGLTPRGGLPTPTWRPELMALATREAERRFWTGLPKSGKLSTSSASMPMKPNDWRRVDRARRSVSSSAYRPGTSPSRSSQDRLPPRSRRAMR